MQKHFPTIWISSIEHMNAFSELSKKNPWWKMLLALNKVPSDFPQVKVGIRKYPLVFYSEGSLTLLERELKYKENKDASLNSQKYSNLKADLNLEIDYSLIKVERYLHPKPLIKLFNINWIKILVSENNSINHILLSSGGSGFNIKQVVETNDEIFETLKYKTTSTI